MYQSITLHPISTYNYNLPIKYQVKLFWKKIKGFQYFPIIQTSKGSKEKEVVRACSYLQTIFVVFWASCRWTKFCKKVQVRQPQVPPTLSFLPRAKPLSFSFLQIYFLAYFSTLTEHVLHPVLSLAIYSSSWEKKEHSEMELHHLHYVQCFYTSENTSSE